MGRVKSLARNQVPASKVVTRGISGQSFVVSMKEQRATIFWPKMGINHCSDTLGQFIILLYTDMAGMSLHPSSIVLVDIPQVGTKLQKHFLVIPLFSLLCCMRRAFGNYVAIVKVHSVSVLHSKRPRCSLGKCWL
jgi:hypothetical protein